MYNIVWKSKIWFVFSAILIAISLSSVAYNKISTWNVLNFWLDFTWWTMIEATFEWDVEKEKVLTVLEDNFHEIYPTVQQTWEKDFFIKSKALDEQLHTNVKLALEENFWKFSETEFRTIWPSVWEKMKENALIAILVAILMIIFYIAFAFRNLPKELSSFKFWFTAIAALTHDIIITIWVFSLMWIFTWVEIDALFITALLTVMWFSVHDTIVVFDRIRENTQRRSKTSNFPEICNNSVNQTLARSINTSVSTLFPLIALYFFWADSIELFVLALVVWIAIWTYSSIFVATPLLVAISHKWELTERKKIKTYEEFWD